MWSCLILTKVLSFLFLTSPESASGFGLSSSISRVRKGPRLLHRHRAIPVSESDDLLLDNDDEEEDDDEPCDVLAGLGLGDQNSKTIFLISDSTGATVKSALQKSLAQFDFTCDLNFDGGDEQQEDRCDTHVQSRTFTYVRSEEAAASIIKTAGTRRAMVIFTMADPSLREKIRRMCDLSSVPSVDLFGPTFETLSSFLEKAPRGFPQATMLLRRSAATLSDSYYRRIESVEFTLKADDGQAPWLLPEADVIVVGVSRTGKTPLSVVLSQTMGLKVANIPLVLEVPPPRELLDETRIDPRRVFCLTVAPTVLKQIRTTRLERRRVLATEDDNNKKNLDLFEGAAKSNYADRAYLLKDLKNARDLTDKYGWTQLDVTGRAVEETASLISEIMNERFDMNQVSYKC